jgi:hypothetical protein
MRPSATITLPAFSATEREDARRAEALLGGRPLFHHESSPDEIREAEAYNEIADAIWSGSRVHVSRERAPEIVMLSAVTRTLRSRAERNRRGGLSHDASRVVKACRRLERSLARARTATSATRVAHQPRRPRANRSKVVSAGPTGSDPPPDAPPQPRVETTRVPGSAADLDRLVDALAHLLLGIDRRAR